MYKVFERLLEQKNVSTADVAKATGIPKSTLSSWKAGNSTPKADKLCHFCANEKTSRVCTSSLLVFCMSHINLIENVTKLSSVDRPFSHHWTLESEVICALGSLSAYVCYPHFATVLFGRSAIRTHRCPFAENGLYLPLANASALFCTDRVATTELGRTSRI